MNKVDQEDILAYLHTCDRATTKEIVDALYRPENRTERIRAHDLTSRKLHALLRWGMVENCGKIGTSVIWRRVV